ncbi:hypothetical protein ATCC90586_011641 [Pythium insidiosum]|nr:hypothetical protein ATCC90586_011641 [Pythium insidiosum]
MLTPEDVPSIQLLARVFDMSVRELPSPVPALTRDFIVSSGSAVASDEAPSDDCHLEEEEEEVLQREEPPEGDHDQDAERLEQAAHPATPPCRPPPSPSPSPSPPLRAGRFDPQAHDMMTPPTDVRAASQFKWEERCYLRWRQGLA